MQYLYMADTYKKLTQREHVLLRPGMYVGSVEPAPGAQQRIVIRDSPPESEPRPADGPPADGLHADGLHADGVDNADFSETESVSAGSVSARSASSGTSGGAGARIALAPDSAIHVPALYKIFDEIVVNALDQVNASGAGVRRIDISIDRASGVIEVCNDGVGLPVEVHSEHGCYAPELIFGHLLTSANYDDADERTIGGQNGIGAKACNIFSEWFEVETLDASRRLLYRQRFESNMLRTLEPVVKDVKAKTPKPYVRVRFLPDYARFRWTASPKTCSGSWSGAPTMWRLSRRPA